MAAEEKPASSKSSLRRKPYRMAYDKTRVARIAFMAGTGCSAAEIAAAMGMKPGHVYWLLFANHIQLVPKTGADVAFPMVLPKRVMTDVESLARELAMPPDFMLARLLEAVLAERNVAVNLLDGVKAPKARKAA